MTDDYDNQLAKIMPDKLRRLAALPEIADTDYAGRVERMRAAQGPVAELISAKPVQLPIWSDPERALPNTLLRSALFGATRRRRNLKRELIASWPDEEIIFTGEAFNQFDESVWLELVHLYRIQRTPEVMHLSMRGILKSMGLKASGQGATRVHDSINRMLACAIAVKKNGVERARGGPVRAYDFDEGRGRWAIELEPRYLKLFGDGHTRLDWDTRKKLTTGLATWMHRYVLSHRATRRNPHRIKLERLKELAGMGSDSREFKRTLRRTMKKLEAVGVVASWDITPGNVLEISRPPKRKSLKIG